MPTESKKKKSKRDEKKVEKKEEKKMSTLLIKTEPIELKSLEHYVDDRVELIRQIFDSLKAKTVESIIPDFLQQKPMEEIQELCLEEMLGISKKRLISIINATKCPTDTESSDSGSDVEKIEEHISLEEISSDSNDELSKPKKKKKHELKKEAPSKKATASTKAATSAKSSEQNGENPEKQYSVLELLELQARARAIRSQLALEPVTKIELDDSDAEDGGEKVKEKEKEKEKGNEKNKEKDKNPKASASSAPPAQNKSNHKEKEPTNSSKRSEESQSKVPAPRPVRLKRNFRQRQVEGYESDDNQSIGEKEKSNENVKEPETSAEKPEEKNASLEEQKSPVEEADPAPAVHDDDVVPIIAEPEVLCISSSDSESDDKSTSSKVKRYITMPVIEKVDRPPTEDELFLLKIKEKSEAKLKSDAAVIKDGKTNDVNNDVANANEKDNTNDQQTEAELAKRQEEMEDGEIVEEDEIFEIAESPEPAQAEETVTETSDTATAKENSEIENEQVVKPSVDLDKSQGDEDNSSSSSSSDSGDEKKSSDSENSDDESDSSEKKSRSLASRNSKKSNVDDDDEDIIDLGKDEDLDFEQLEMRTACEKPKKDESPRRTRSKTKSHKSDDRDKSDEPKDESWDKRWLRGDKVSKVLATAKLANKVRSKIIEKKSKTVAKCQTPEVEAPKEPEPAAPSNAELGSVEHYKELTKQK